MKTFTLSLWLALILALSACQSATPTPSPTPAGQMETQLAATIFANQTSTAAAEQKAGLTLTAAVPSSTSTPPLAPTTNIFNINIAAGACWVNSGVKIVTGQTVVITASGTANTWGGKDISTGGPDGQPANMCGAVECPLRGANYGALIGRVGKGDTFLVGSHLEFTASADGELFLTINDWECADNIGSFNVSITIQ